MTDLKLDNEFGAVLAGAGSRPQFANLVKYRQKDLASQREYPTLLKLSSVTVQVGARAEDVDAAFREEINDAGVSCFFRIANEHFKTPSFKPDGGKWEGEGSIQFMLSGNSHIFVKVAMTGETEAVFGYAKLSLLGLGEGDFELTGEIKESEYVTPHDELLGYLTVSFTVVPNFSLTLRKLENQFDTKNLPALMNVISQESKTLGHRMGAFQNALNILQNIVSELQRAGAFGQVTSKQLSVILNQASSAQGVELFEDLLWDVAKLSFAEHIFEPSLTYFPPKPEKEAVADSKAVTGDMFDASNPFSFALHMDLQDPVVLVADTEADYLRWTTVLKVACDANSETNPEKLKKLVIPDFCKDQSHPDRPTAGWLRRKKANRKALTGDYVRRFFRLTCDSECRYSLSYSHEPTDDPKLHTQVPLQEGTRLLTPQMLGVPTPFALSITVVKLSDFSFQNAGNINVVAQLGNQRQRTPLVDPKATTTFNSHLLLPVQRELLPHANESVTTVNIGWFGEEVVLPPAMEEDPVLRFFVGSNPDISMNDCLGRCRLPFHDLPFGRTQELTLPLMGTNAEDAEITVSITMRRLGQYKTAWPARKTRIIQTASDTDREENKWEGPCMVRAAPQGLEVFSIANDSESAATPVSVLDYYAIESITAINDSTLDITVIMEENTGSSVVSAGGEPLTPTRELRRTMMDFKDGAPDTPGGGEGHKRNSLSISPGRRGGLSRRSSFGMVTTKGKSLSPARAEKAEKGKSAPPNNYVVLRISPCPAETLKDLVRERKWMFRDRSMLLYIMHKLHDQGAGEDGGLDDILDSMDPKTQEKLALASAETYRRLRTNMNEIIKTANWKHARGVGFTEEHIRMFFRLQRLSCYFAKLVESRARPVWALGEDASPRSFARSDLDKIFSSQYVQAGTFGAEAQGIENSVKGVGHALRSLNRRMDEVKLYYHASPEEMEKGSATFFHEYFLRCIGELGAHVISDDVLQEVPIEVVVAFVCFLVKRDKAFHELLIENAFEPDRNAFLTTILSIDSMIRRLTKRTELEIVAQWPKEGDIGDDAGPYVASLLGDCSPDSVGKLSTRAPEALMRLLEKYVQLISSQCRARGNLGAKIFEGMFFALPSYASNAAETIAKLNHRPCAWNSVRYLSAILNDMNRAGELMEELVRTNTEHLDGIPIDLASVQSGVFSSGVEVACLLADVALSQMDTVCAEFWQAEWYSDDDNAVMRKACKLLCRKMDELAGMVHADPFFQHVVEAGVEKIAFRYLLGFIHRATDQSGGKMISKDELDKMSSDIDMMEQFLRKYGPTVLTSVFHLKEVMVMMTEQPEVMLQAVFVDILKRHEGKEDYVFRLLKIATAARDDLRSFYVPSWVNKLKQKMTSIVQERVSLEEEGDARSAEITFDVFEWCFTANMEKSDGPYIYRYLQECLKNARDEAAKLAAE
jgi:hypothetical protein